METTTEIPAKKATSPRTVIIRVILGLGVLAGLYYAYTVWDYNRHHESTDNAQVEAYLVPVLPRVAGYVKAVHVQDYDHVTKDQVLVEMDENEFQLALDELEASYQQAQADIANARANIINTQLSYKTALANSELARIRLNKAKADADRDARLFQDNAITRKQQDDSQNNLLVFSQQFNTSRNDAAVAQSRINVLQSTVQKAQAAARQIQSRIDQQKLRLSYTQVKATQSGRIGKKNAEPGQFVQAGQTLMTIVNDSVFWAVANFKETQIARIKIGDEVEMKVDGYKDVVLKGKIAAFSEATGAKFSLLPPDNASGNFVKVTQRIPVKIEILEPQKYKNILRAGVSLEVSVLMSYEL
jgi:membrane fusion protein, multidrug efflux system